MKTLALILFLFSTSAMAMAVGDAIKIDKYCATIADFEAYMLRGQPSIIPDDIDCYWSDHVTFMGTVIERVKDFESDEQFLSLFRVGNLAVLTGAGFQPLEGTVFVPGLKDGQGA